MLTGRDVVLLWGELGAGKTTFAQAVLGQLGSSETTSPTFSLHNEYDTREGLVDHLDLYRLDSAEELEGIGFWDLFDRQRGLILVEWPDRIPEGQLPEGWARFDISIRRSSEENARDITIKRWEREP